MPVGPGQSVCARLSNATDSYSLLVSATPDRAGRTAIARYLETFAGNATSATPPGPLVNFGQAVNFPLILGVVVGASAWPRSSISLSSPCRPRRDIGILKALGFLDRQVGATVYWQAATIAVVALVVGVPLGVAAGKVVWTAFAQYIGVVPVSVVQAGLVASIAVGTLVVAVLLAIGPAVAAARSKPGRLLTER